MAFNSTRGALGAKRKAPLTTSLPDHASSLLSEALWVVFNPADRMDVLSLSTNPLTTEESDLEHTRPLEPALDLDILADPDSPPGALSLRIAEWQRATETEVTDNMASWDLDDALAPQLDRSLLPKVPAFYGDLHFDAFSPADYARFQRALARLKSSLTRKGYSRGDPALLSRLLDLLHWQRLLRSLGSLVTDYVANTLARTHVDFRRGDFSDSASSSLVMCGPSSWNDL